jgi:fructuronate reductase
MKLRMLNGTHSTLAYLGYLAGHQTISPKPSPIRCSPAFVKAAVADRRSFRPSRRLRRASILWPMPMPCSTRYANPGIRHRTWQIAMDGSQKLPQRILGTLEGQSF